MRHGLDELWVSLQYFAQDSYVRLRHSAYNDPLLFYGRLAIAFALLVLLVSISITVLRSQSDTSSTIADSDNLSSSHVDDSSQVPQQSAVDNSSADDDPDDSSNGTYFRVASVTDGDTIKVNIDNQVTTIRLIGLDTPETNHPSKPVECFGREATAKMQSLIGAKTVRLESDSTQDNIDKYGRLLRYVYTTDGENVAHLMIKNGYAYEYTYYLPYKYQSEFKQAEQHARDNKLGLWAPDACAGSSTSTQSPSAYQSQAFAANPDDQSQPATNVYYRNCSAARAAGAAPVYIGEPGYGVHLDRDRDGIGCE